MAKAPTGPTKPEAGVIATRPATAPEQMPITVGLPFSAHSTSIQVKRGNRGRDLGHQHRHAGLHPRRDGGAGVEAEPADPQQRGADEGQHHVVRRPGILSRLPSMIAHISPATPALICTTVPPAKSSTFTHAASLPEEKMPSGPQTQCAIGA